MKQKALFLSTALLLVAGCSSSVNSDGSGGDKGSGGDGGAGTGASNPTGAGNGSQGGSGTGGANPDLNGKTVTLTMDTFHVASGAEVYKCQNFKNPFDGDAEVGMFESEMTAGSHHLLLFYRNDVTEDGPEEDCSGLEFAATPYGSQQPTDHLSFPEGVAAQIPPGTGFRVQAHYLNTGPALDASVKVTFHLDDPAKVKQHAGVLFVVQPQIDIEPHSQGKVSYDCDLPVGMNIIRAYSHMHQHGTSFSSTIGGKKLYDTTTWNEPKPELYDPAFTAKQGDPLHFECNFVNDGETALHFGESAATNEMCILTASFYPALDGAPTSGCRQNP